jgi:hypothetical protein
MICVRASEPIFKLRRRTQCSPLGGCIAAHKCVLRQAHAMTINPAGSTTCQFSRDSTSGTATSSDAGSHYVCVNLTAAETPGGAPYSSFWTITGQAKSGVEAATWPLPGCVCVCVCVCVCCCAWMYGDEDVVWIWQCVGVLVWACVEVCVCGCNSV